MYKNDKEKGNKNSKWIPLTPSLLPVQAVSGTTSSSVTGPSRRQWLGIGSGVPLTQPLCSVASIEAVLKMGYKINSSPPSPTHTCCALVSTSFCCNFGRSTSSSLSLSSTASRDWVKFLSSSASTFYKEKSNTEYISSCQLG